MFGLAILFGGVVGFALGLTGGGGGVFALPLLVYGLSVAPREAVGISLASVGGTALFGALSRWKRGEVEFRTGLLFAIAGMCGAPLGSHLSRLVAEEWLLGLFAILMLVVAYRMWSKTQGTRRSREVCPAEKALKRNHATCQRDADGTLCLTSRCSLLLISVGLVAGVLSGMFGVGGGFVIVPALVLFSGMAIHQAVGTSLFVIVLVSLSGVSAHFWAGNALSPQVVLLFMFGGFVGMWLGGVVAQQLKGPTLQKTFSIAVVMVAAFVIFQSAIA